MLEKLMVTPDCDFSDVDKEKYPVMIFTTETIIELKRQRDEMLEALVKIKKALEYHDSLGYLYASEEDSITDAIEKATGRTWEEVKELIC